MVLTLEFETDTFFNLIVSGHFH